MVVAASTNGVIGNRGELPWRLPEDLRRFRQLTLGKPVVMGRKTRDAIGRALPGRRNIVVTRNKTPAIEGCEVASSPDEALALATGNGAAEVMIIGGGSLYRQLLPRTDLVQMTRVHAVIEGDAFFPELDPGEWRCTWSEAHPATAERPIAFTFETLERR